MNIDDPKLTALALDELDEPERSTIAREVAQSPDAQRVIDETRELARALKNEFAAETARNDGFQAVEGTRRSGDRRSLSDIRDDPWFWTTAGRLSIAAVLALFAVIGGLVFWSAHNESTMFVDHFASGGPVYLPPEKPGDVQGELSLNEPMGK